MMKNREQLIRPPDLCKIDRPRIYDVSFKSEHPDSEYALCIS